ncbi:unnamed protein product [Spirodela intermedia]|uniref:Uncharacterized protein n=1 Tax=Spirodela intermedia TaxID=51605 RepID=A0A7I8I8A3_SPIIN|nr:unnamed protein product [Spirodela intermedia]CAA6653810.1 unnamed protein product [Spirodela intermedia]
MLQQRPRLPPPLPPPISIMPIRPDVENEAGYRDEMGSINGEEGTSRPGDVLRLMDALRLPVEADLYASLLKDPRPYATQRRGLLRGTGGTILMNRLLLAYAAAGEVERALEVLEGMPKRDSISWVTMIAGLSAAGDHTGALRLFREMLREWRLGGGGATVILSVTTVLRCCGSTRDLKLGKCVHGLLLKNGASGCSTLGSSLIRLYGLLGRADDAERVFRSMRARDWAVGAAAMTVACCKMGMIGTALDLFGEMRKAGRRTKGHLFSSIFRACARAGADLPGRQVHACAVKTGVEGHEAVRNSLVEMYGRCGLLLDERRVLEIMPEKEQ